jgi:hypothetical protein
MDRCLQIKLELDGAVGNAARLGQFSLAMQKATGEDAWCATVRVRVPFWLQFALVVRSSSPHRFPVQSSDKYLVMFLWLP